MAVKLVRPSSLFLDFCVSLLVEDWQQVALQLFRKHGFVIIKGALDADRRSQLESACRSAEAEILEVANRSSSGRSAIGSRGKGRFSFANASKTGSMFHEKAWAELLECTPLQDMIALLMPDGGRCVVAGGDFVLPNTDSYQPLHSDFRVDGDAQKTFDVDFPPPYISANFVVSHIDSINGPMRIIPGTARVSAGAQRRQLSLPSVDDEPSEWKASTLQPLEPGDLLLRDVRVLHGGTPNLSNKTRFLPSLEFVLDDFRQSRYYKWLEPRSMPEDIWDTLSYKARGLLAWDLVKERKYGELDIGWHESR
eukprot:TRINITY_DN6685_c1_g1_i1.p1 TRINITY_DN6685_c1_g1~~TRINITY_DN6685_c1_g1_i1.p1  ORF type:complete len:309 (+),score=30.07 TRINITY_DN6685_c1_g1_i1:452-1378(+)